MTQRKRRFWIDPRFVIGAVLVVGSVVGVIALVAALDRTVLVFSAARVLSVGDRVDADDLAVAEVSLGASEARYLRAEDLPVEGAVVLRSVGKGELLPAASVGSASSVDLASVSVPTSLPLPRNVETGAQVDLWASPREDLGSFGPPRVLVASATVARLSHDESFGGGAGEAVVELLVPRDDVAEVLNAVANEDAIALVSVGAGIGAE